ncbi:ROK family transcriptional regulator [Aquibacillus albus]|uniref:Glucokinase-like ROK family protein n=1 Tax=Aquibacillus albus TaxID=1168171 RepID=A0ABS2MWL6_9BACI|nr:ROK family transcriptional regulator [Aquibacillus albus]MBM7570291.1 glucokinase-like ROK family protein [Aquibacillus albus]
MSQTWNQFVVKKENKTLVLETVKSKSPLSRADIAQFTGLNKGTVSSLVSELIDEKLIYESGPGKSSGGRRPVMLYFNEVAGYSIGIDLGVNYLLGILTDLNGNIINEKTIKFKDENYQKIEGFLFEIIEFLQNAAPSSPYGIIGIGVGVPGIVNNDGEILIAPNLGWKQIHLKTIIEDKYHIPVVIENEANAGAYGEKKFGAGEKFENIIYVSVGIGIGVGFILDGSLYKGKNGSSGEMGHMTIEVNGLPCSCGNQGCWELYASEKAVLRKAEQQIFLSSNQELSLDALNSLAIQGDKGTIRLFEEIGDYLGVGINNIINTFNPEQVIIGNRIASLKDWIIEPIESRTQKSLLDYQQKDLCINFSQLSIYSAALGVVAFSIENFLKIELVENK